MLAAFQYRTLEKLSVLSPMVRLGTPGRTLEYLLETIDFDAVDGLLAFLVLALAVSLLGLEVFAGGLRRALRWVGRSDWRAGWVLAFSGVVACRYYFGLGDLSWVADSSHHILTAEVASRALQSGIFPFWTNHLGTGSPYLLFYGPLFFYVTAAVDLLLHDIQLSLKLALGVCHAASGIGVYAFLRAGGTSRQAAIVGGLAYVLIFWHTQQVIIMGRYPLALVYLLLPWPFAAAESVLQRRSGPRLVLAGGVALGALIWTHPAYGIWAAALLCLYLLCRWIGDSRARRHAGAAVALVVVGGACGSYVAVPMWWEQDLTGLSLGIDLSGVPSPTWQHLVVWSSYRIHLLDLDPLRTNWYGAYLGLSCMALAGFGLASARLGARDRSSRMAASAVCLALVLFLALAGRWSGLAEQPGIRWLGSGRFLLFAVLFLAVLAGHGSQWLALRWRRPEARSLPVLLLLLDLGPTTFQQVYVRPDAETDAIGVPVTLYEPFRQEMSAARTEQLMPPFRALWAGGTMSPYLTQAMLHHFTRAPMPHAPRPGELLAVVNFVWPLERYLSAALSAMPIDDGDFEIPRPALEALQLLNVRYILATRPTGSILRLGLRHPGPVVVAPAAAHYEPDTTAVGDWLELQHVPVATISPSAATGVPGCLATIARYGLEPESSTCAQIPLRSPVAARDLGTHPEVGVSSHEVREQETLLRLQLSAAGFVRLPYAYYRHLEVTVDGQPAQVLESADHFIVLQLPAGEHTIKVVARLSWLRRLLLTVAVGLALAAVAVWVRESVHGRRRSP